jgi:hypothetical protein
MKKIIFCLVVILLTLPGYNAQSQTVTLQDAASVATNFLIYHSSGFTILQIEPVNDNSRQLAWVAQLSPDGFILISNSYQLRPVLAYSFESPWNIGGNEEGIFHTLMFYDLKSRLDFPDLKTVIQAKNQQEWDEFILGTASKDRFEQWPPAGTTPTGGWLFTNWTQSAPYNGMCPIDPNTNQRSYNGCPATAMAQILNCLIDIKGTRMTDADDYYHNFGSGNKYWIDNDWQTHGFPYFDSLNLYLDSLEYNYLWNKPIDNNQKAALNFACGVALKQVYSSSGSGTWGIEQAGVAWQRFGFTESRLVYDSDTALNSDLAENIKQGWLAHLGLVDPPVSVGHNVVVDGYNTDEFYHFNFGWGGSSNGWYTMPPTNIPYNLTVIEGIVLDIMGNNPHVGIHQSHSDEISVTAQYLPLQNQLLLSFDEPENSVQKINLYSISGQMLTSYLLVTNQNQKQYEITLPELKTGLLFVQIDDGKIALRTVKVMIQR